MSTLKQALDRQPKLNRFLCHLYQRLEHNRLTLVTGAGISIDAGVPTWDGLLQRLAESSEQLKTDFEKHRSSGFNPEYLGQIIYHRHRSQCAIDVAADIREETINNAWARAIHAAIYQNVPESTDKIVEKHPYIAAVRDLARKIPLVINFNFDDILSETIGHQNSQQRENRRSMKVVWEPPLVDRSDTTTIYHVNGMLPRTIGKKRSSTLIFTEDSFASALARSPEVGAEYLFLRFVQNTMLLIGHSLSDSSLKNYLRRNRDKNPANHHYMIYWMKDASVFSAGQLQDVFDANLELYNLITIFLTSREIGSFFEILNLEPREFRDKLDGIGPDNRHGFFYYIAGPVASGKSSLLERLRCFNTYEEWTRPPPKEMYLSFDKLSEAEAAQVDEFVYGELKEKNVRMSAAGIGFHFMDRAPLDLYTFSKDDDERRQKTSELEKKVTRAKPLQSGEIIFVTARGETLVKRNMNRGRPPETAGNPSYFDRQHKSLFELYTPNYSVSTDGRSPDEVAKMVVRHVLLDEYSPLEFASIMERYK